MIKQGNKRFFRPLILFLTISIFGVTFLTGCDNKQESLIDILYKNKTEYLGDNSKVVNIVSSLEYPKGYKYVHIELLTENEGDYQLNIVLEESDEPHKLPDEHDVIAQSAILFSLIENLDKVAYVTSKNDKNRTIVNFERSRIDSITISVLGMKTEELGGSKSKFEKLIEFYEENQKQSEQKPNSINNSELKATEYKVVNNLKGVIMGPKEGTINKKGLSLIFISKIYSEALYSEDFVLETKIDGKWYQVPLTIDGNYGFHDIGYILPPGEENELKVEWEWLYGELRPGEYRIIKRVLNSKEEGGQPETYYLAAEFEVQ